ncbi:hypothetical protein [Halorarius litoreus]|uniref:hypothetical protein n=1 Tax=Halorarius litoreus TaxID=2962676 RepID=UPI0020CC360D|nr:hypothetical protein [Halorarius litoreus]
MSTVALASALFGRDRAVSRRLGLVAVALSVAAFGFAWLSNGLQAGGVLSPRGVLVALAYGTVGVGSVVALVGTFRNSGLLTCWLLVCGPVAGLAAYGAVAGGIRATGPVDALLAGGLWGVGAAVTLGTLLFALGVAGRLIDEGRLAV